MQASNAIATLERTLQPLAPQFADALGKIMPPERLIRTVVVSCERLPKLLDCDRQSLFNAAMSAACLGLEVDGVTGQAFLIPFKGRAQLVIGYKGMNTLAARSGITITGKVVREGDDFDFDLAEGWVKHRPKFVRNAKVIAAWAKAASNNRPPVVEVMSIDDLLAVKGKSPGAARSDSPWNDPLIGFPAMCEKTVKRRLGRSMPLNVMQLAARMDEAFDEQGKASHITPERGLVIDGEIMEPSPTPTASQLLDVSPRPTKDATAVDASPADDTLSPRTSEPSAGEVLPLEDMAREAAQRGREVLRSFYRQRTPDEQKILAGMKAELDALMPADA